MRALHAFWPFPGRAWYSFRIVVLRALFIAVASISLLSLPTVGLPLPPGRGGRLHARVLGPRPPWRARQRRGVRVIRPEDRKKRARDGRTADILLDRLHRDAQPGARQGPRRALRMRDLRDLGLQPRGLMLIDPSRWPPEPPTPSTIDAKHFAAALARLCPVVVSEATTRRYARWIQLYGEQFEVDPFLLGALIYQQSRCNARKHNSYGVGLAQINPGMYKPSIKQGGYRFGLRDESSRLWRRQVLEVGRFSFDRQQLLAPESNIYFAAAFISVFARQCPTIDPYFRGIAHRHPISHFIWGDRVRGAGPEDRILEARRRLLAYYHRGIDPPGGRFGKLTIGCPLDGNPRVVTSGMGDDRAGGKRRHAGIDLASYYGEPIRTIADGEVVLAGVDRGEEQFVNVEPQLANLASPWTMGPRGVFVRIRHAGGLDSLYAHLAAYTVKAGQRVKRGQLIGYVGKSGIKLSDPHLHLSLYDEDKAIDPIPPLGRCVFPTEATYYGQRRVTTRDARRARARRRRQERCLNPFDCFLESYLEQGRTRQPAR